VQGPVEGLPASRYNQGLTRRREAEALPDLRARLPDAPQRARHPDEPSMTQNSLIERITRSLAYMLRHRPEEFDIELDRHGAADLDEVIHVLNERIGEAIEEEDVLEAIESGDRPRYAIDGDRIRALYGHSIPIDPGEPDEPPDLLYAGVGSRDADRAERFGLESGRRAFLHLATTYEDARETGRRVAEEYAVVTVQAGDAWEDGINFYDRGALWLSESIPTEFIEVGELQDDGIARPTRGGRGPRGGRGGRRGRDRDRGRDRGRSRDRDDDRDERRPARSQRREEPAAEASPRREARAETSSPAPEKPARVASADEGFGLGIFGASQPDSEASSEPQEEILEVVELEPIEEQEAEAAAEEALPEEPSAETSTGAEKQPADDGGGFGLGIF